MSIPPIIMEALITAFAEANLDRDSAKTVMMAAVFSLKGKKKIGVKMQKRMKEMVKQMAAAEDDEEEAEAEPAEEMTAAEAEPAEEITALDELFLAAEPDIDALLVETDPLDPLDDPLDDLLTEPEPEKKDWENHEKTSSWTGRTYKPYENVLHPSEYAERAAQIEAMEKQNQKKRVRFEDFESGDSSKRTKLD